MTCHNSWKCQCYAITTNSDKCAVSFCIITPDLSSHFCMLMHQCINKCASPPSDQYPISNYSVLLYNYHVILSDDFSVQLFQFKSKTTDCLPGWEWLICAVLIQTLIMACDFTYMLDDLICPLEIVSSDQLYCAPNKSYSLSLRSENFFFSVLLWSLLPSLLLCFLFLDSVYFILLRQYSLD